MPFNLDESNLVAAERTLGARLPESYRESMLRANGGVLEVNGDVWQQHPIADTSERKRLSRTTNHVIVETQSFQGFSGFPANALSIASNGTGDSLLFLQRGGMFEPAVYLWSHETRHLAKVANDFSDLAAP